MKRVLSVQDISCVGKCSLTVALPIISAMGVETAVVPTAVLSTHTAFKNFTFHDLTNQIEPIAQHWKQEKIGFDAIYTGYLGSFEQIRLVTDFIRDFRTPENVVFVDPAMADNGKLYPGFDQEFADCMATLCGHADVIVPNLSEAAFMLHKPYLAAGEYNEQDIRDLLKDLTGLGAKIAVLTGVSLEKGKLGVMGYDSVRDEYFSYYTKHLPVSFHGTGDVFASTCVGAIALEKPLLEALSIAADYTVDCIQKTVDDPKPNWYGVNFEQALAGLIKRLNP